jgi:hypothetical protein
MEQLRAERDILVVHASEMPGFVVDRKAGDVAGITVSETDADAAGAAAVKEYGIENPIGLVQQRVIARMASDAEITNLKESATPVTSEEIADLKRALGPVTALALRTKRWGVRYHPDDPDIYGAFYEVRARLVRLTDGRVLWEGSCERQKYWDDPEPALLSDLTAAGGRLMKARLQGAAERCADDLVAQFLGKSRPGGGNALAIVRKRPLLPDVRTALFSDPGLVTNGKRFEADFIDVPVQLGEALEVVKIIADARTLSPASEITLHGTTVSTPFEAKIKRTAAGRLDVRVEGLLFDDEQELRRVVETFRGPALKELTVEGRIGERLIKIRYGPKGVDR